MVKLTFLGGARTVTGSCYLLETDNLKILVDCGMFQGKRELRMRNYHNFKVSPQNINYILLTHAHIDHSGLIPRLYKQGFRGKVIATKATADLCEVMLPDSGHIQEVEAEWEARKARRRGEKALEPLYTAMDAIKCMEVFEGVSYEQEISLDEQVRVRFLDAGHILGSAIIEVWVKENGKEIKIVFSGDLGNTGATIIRDPVWVNEADYVLLESTYGDRLHEPMENQAAQLKEIIAKTIAKRGNVVIPAFAVGRTQEILYALNNLIENKELPPVPVYIDSPLAVSATKIFEQNKEYYNEDALSHLRKGDDPFEFPGLIFVREAEESKAINDIQGGKVIISASGMCDAGRIKHHLKHNLWRSESAVVFVGFQAEGTLGRRILDGEKKVKILGETISVAAQIHSLPGFSAHADQTGLLDWISRFTRKPQSVFVVHGEVGAATTLAGLIEQRTGVSALIPDIGEEYILKPAGLELTRQSIHVTELHTKQRLLLSIFRLEKKLAELKEEILLSEERNWAEESLETLNRELEDRINAFEQLIIQK